MKIFVSVFTLLLGLLISVSFASQVESQSSLQKQNLKIIALAPHIVELLFDIGAEKQIIATSSYADYPVDAKSLLQVGDHSRLQIEKIVQLQPDVIIAWKSGNPLADLDRLQQYGLKVVYSNPIQLADVAKELVWLGELTGREEAANFLAQEYKFRLQRLTQRYQHRPEVTVFYEIWSNPLQTIAGKAWPQQQLDICAANNIFSNIDEDYPSVSLEQVLTLKPQVIIQPRSPQNLIFHDLDWQKYSFVPAVENNFIFHPNADKVYRMTLRVLDEVASLCNEIDQARQHYFLPST
ncbi:cobalamin-binding protein [Aliiglaciecola sp. LCG003]|uniref:cobalamin-binding protein n=1 Tax=Aliiglaciecola sp. LCG003 TaxID=3053655 RepID=UPI00257386AA|nr:cobalamin-binding protein [Aliiglaciecola sp. LCG003]WJG09007.1 cobalamin-binding protein [Aliiglaciecola sp. LCG003]